MRRYEYTITFKTPQGTKKTEYGYIYARSKKEARLEIANHCGIRFYDELLYIIVY